MVNKRRRSSLRKSTIEAGNRNFQTKRRISFSGKNSVRVFHGEEEPKTWNNSYEISDNLNGNESTSNLCASVLTTKLSSAVENVKKYKENTDPSVVTHQVLEVHSNQEQQIIANSNLSVLTLTKDMINASYHNQNSKLYQIDDSVDITLCEMEKKFQFGKAECSYQATNLCSFSLKDREAENRPPIVPCERTMLESNDTTVVGGNDMAMRSKNIKLPVYMSDSFSISTNGQIICPKISADIEKNISLELSPNIRQQCDKENVDAFATRKANEANYNSFEMETGKKMLSHSQENTVNVEKESIAFQYKLNALSFPKESDGYKQVCNIYDDMKLNNQPRSIINSVQLTHKNSNNNTTITNNITIQNLSSQPNINFNKAIEFAPNNTTKKCEEIEGDIKNSTGGKNNTQGAIPKVKLRLTSNVNKTIDISPLKVNENFPSNTWEENEHLKLASEYLSDNDLKVSGGIRKYSQQPKVVVRKICAPLVNRNKNSVDLEQQRLIRYKKKQQQNEPFNSTSVKLTEKSLNFSLDSLKNMSESTSPLIPSEFKGYTLRQLNDEIECGKIKVFPNDPEVTNSQQEGRAFASTTTKEENTLHFEDLDITSSSDDTLHVNFKTTKAKKKIDINITKGKAREDADMTQENTSFLTRTKLSNETVFRNNCKRNLTQIYDIIDIFDASLMKAAIKHENDTSGLNTQTEKSWCLNDAMDISNEIEKEPEKDIHPSLLVQSEKSTKPIRQTEYYDNNIGANDLNEAKGISNFQTSMNESVEANVKEKEPYKKSITARKTLLFNDAIPLKEELTTVNQKNIEIGKNIDAQNSNSTRKTIYFNDEFCEFEKELAIDKKICQSRKSVYTPEDMNVTLNEDILEISIRNSNPTTTLFFNNEFPLDKTSMIIQENIESDFENKIPTQKESITIKQILLEKSAIRTEENVELEHADIDICHLTLPIMKADSNNEISLEGDPFIIEQKNTLAETSFADFQNLSTRKTFYYSNENCELNESLQAVDQKVSQSKDNKIMSVDQSFASTEKFQFPEAAECLNAAKTTLVRQISGNYLDSMSKSKTKQGSFLMTPIKDGVSHRNQTLFCMTPRLSLLEFTALEKAATEDEILQSMGSLGTEIVNKRHTANLTPILSISKRRQTLISAVELTKKNEKPEYISNNATNDAAADISRIADESELPTPPREQRSISSVNKSNKSFPLNGAGGTNLNETFEVDMESIQFVRKSIFTQRKDSITSQRELDEELVVDAKPAIFEGITITISDVSAYFETQKKSTSDIQKSQMNLALEKTGTNVLNSTEKPTKDFENRYLNLTLEDIALEKTGTNVLHSTEKPTKVLESRYLNLTLEDIGNTRLSLVQTTYENGTTNESDLHQKSIDLEEQLLPSDAIISENSIDLQSIRDNVKYLPDSSESFSMPKSPPLPDIGLDRLRRLRKLPILDINSLCQRVSLDDTIINDCKISSDKDETMRYLDDEAEDKPSVVTKFIKKYEEDKISFEKGLQEKYQKKLSSEKSPFVIRLNDLLRINCTNWIFDYQMQHQGILLFSHRKMITFALSVTYEEMDALGHEISLKSIKLVNGHFEKKNWKPIDFWLDFQFKFNLPFNIQWLCKGSDEGSVLKMLQEVDRSCLDTVKMGNCLLRICFRNKAYIRRDERRTYIHKIIREIVVKNDFKYVKKDEIKIELLNLTTLNFKDIIFPPLHNFREEIQLLPTGLQFLEKFLPNPHSYLRGH